MKLITATSPITRTCGVLTVMFTGPLRPAQLEVEVVEVHAFDPLAAGLRLEAGQARVAEFLVSGPVAGGNALQQAAIEGQQFIRGRIGHD